MIYNEDCVTGMSGLADGSFDIIIVDPPYNIGKDFGNNSDKQKFPDYLVWCSEWISQCERLLSPVGSMYIYGFSETLAHISVRLSVDYRWLVWHYTNKTVPHIDFWQHCHESILHCYHERPHFNRDEVREEYTEGFLHGSVGKKRVPGGRFGEKESIYTAHEKGALPRDVIKIPTLAGGSGIGEKMFLCKDCNYVGTDKKNHRDHDMITHPTQKPIALTEKLVKAVMKPGMRVLIPFCGSGSEYFVAKKFGLEATAFELNPDYVRMAKEFMESKPKRR